MGGRAHERTRHPKPPDGAGWRRRRLTNHLSAILRLVCAAPRVVLFLDFDGTLAPLRRRAEDVRLTPKACAVLRRLAKHRRLAIFIISGRRRADLRRRVRLRGVRCLGVHGWEGLLRAGLNRASVSALHRALGNARRDLSAIPGIRIEDKRWAFAVHYRGSPAAAVRRARRRLLNLLRPFRRQLRIMGGKKVWEVLPHSNRGKGAAVQRLLEGFPDGSLPIYIGDDTADEAAFEALRGGVTVRVGKAGRTRARWDARNPADVLRILEALETELR